MMKRLINACLCILILSFLFLSNGCISAFTSIERENDGTYVITGHGQSGLTESGGFVWFCEYDPKTMTLFVKEEIR